VTVRRAALSSQGPSPQGGFAWHAPTRLEVPAGFLDVLHRFEAEFAPASSIEPTEATDAFATSASSATTPVPSELSDTSDATPVSSECNEI
jgi:hypothetical protein